MTPQNHKKSDSLSPPGVKALSVEALVRWAYHDQRADLTSAGGGGGPAGYDSSFDAFDGLAMLGAVIGRSTHSGKVHDDAWAVHDRVCQLGRDTRDLIMLHGFMRTRPDPRIGARERLEPFWHYETRADGIVLRAAPWAKLPKSNVFWVELHLVDAKREVARDREHWAMWAEGLHGLHSWLSGEGVLRVHSLTADLPDLTPWALDSK